MDLYRKDVKFVANVTIVFSPQSQLHVDGEIEQSVLYNEVERLLCGLRWACHFLFLHLQWIRLHELCFSEAKTDDP
jgi:hypothetical protein